MKSNEKEQSMGHTHLERIKIQEAFKFGGVNLKNECRMVRHRINRVKGVLSGPELA